MPPEKVKPKYPLIIKYDQSLCTSKENSLSEKQTDGNESKIKREMLKDKYAKCRIVEKLREIHSHRKYIHSKLFISLLCTPIGKSYRNNRNDQS